MDDRQQNMLGAFVLAVADQIRAETEAAVGHTGASAAALVTIAQFPGGTVEELRRSVGLSHPAAVRVVDRLVEQRLVKRSRSGPGPAVALTVTANGTKRARKILDVRRKVLRDALPDMSQADSKALTRVLERGLANLADADEPIVCRLCDKGRCRRADCPVVKTQIQRGNEPPEFTQLD